MRVLWQVWAEVRASKLQAWKTVAARSSLRWVAVAETFTLADSLGWQMSDRLRRQVQRMFRHQYSTLLNERAFQKLRDHERDNSSHEIFTTSVWRKPTLDKVLSGVHDYEEINVADVEAPNMQAESLPASLFKPVLRESSHDFKDLPGRGPAPFSTMKACNLHTLGSDTDMMMYYGGTGQLEEAVGSWRSLLVEPGTLLRDRRSGKTSWVLSASSGMLYIWPAMLVKVSGFVCWRLQPGEGKNLVEPISIVNFERWAAAPYQFKPPASMFVGGGRKSRELPPTPACQTDGDLPLLEYAAPRAFRMLNTTQLRKLDKEEFGILDQEASLAEILVALVAHVLGISENEAARIAMQRCHRIDTDERCSILQSEEASSVLDHWEWKAVVHEVERMKTAEEATADLLVGLRKFVKRSPEAPPAKRARTLRVSKWSPVVDSVEKAAVLLPPGCRLWADPVARRYQAFYDGSSCSRDWLRYGSSKALRMVIQWAWSLYVKTTGHECPIEGLFALPSCGAASSAS